MTPQDKDGNSNLRYLFSAVEKIKEIIDKREYVLNNLCETVKDIDGIIITVDNELNREE